MLAQSLSHETVNIPEQLTPNNILFNLGLTEEIRSFETGPEIKTDLANIVNKMVRDGILEDKLAEKLKKYPTPTNCDALTRVTVNKLIWEKMTPNARSYDVKMQKVQTNIIAGIAAVVKAVDQLLDIPNVSQDMIKILMDSVALFATANKEVNLRRREHIKPELNQTYKHLCSNSLPITAELFGDDVSKQVKELTEVNRVGRRITGRPYAGNYPRRRGQSRGYYSYPRGNRGYSNYPDTRGRGTKRSFLGVSPMNRPAIRGKPTNNNQFIT